MFLQLLNKLIILGLPQSPLWRTLTPEIIFSILSADLMVYHVFFKLLIANLCGCLVFLSTLSTDSNVHGIFSLPPVQSSGHSVILQCLSEFSHVFQERSILVKRYISYIKKFREFWHNQTDFRIKVKSRILPFLSI